VRQIAIFQLQTLEQRMFLSVAVPAASSGAADASGATFATAAINATPPDLLTKALRQQIVDRWNGSNKASLQTLLNQNKMGAFDGALLDYMKARTGNTFYWNRGDVAGIQDFINANLATSNTINNANSIVAHRFPDGNSEVYDVQLPAGPIDFSTTTSNVDFYYTLNRHEFWLDLSQAYILTGDSKYTNELKAQLADWSAQNPGGFTPNEWRGKGSDGNGWQPLSVATRAMSWTWAYQMLLGSSQWDAQSNTLFLYKLYEHGDFLRRVTPYALDTNRSLFEAQGLLDIAHLVPEFIGAADWKTYGRGLLFGAMDNQLNADGGHAESSPGYATNVVSALLELYYLDQKKGEGDQWPSQRVQTLQKAASALVQLLTPDGKQPALSDTYRGVIGPFWLKPRIILNSTEFPAAKPRLRDVWLFGAAKAGEFVTAPVNPGVPTRPNTYSMPQSGYYVMRSGPDANARQITFDAGPKGKGHGHSDLLSFELFGYGKPLIADPGLYTYDDSERRTWAISTVAHNTINVDRQNHEALEGVDNPKLWSSGLSEIAGGYQITATHGGYNFLDNASVYRSIWYDGDGVMLVADLGTSSAPHTFATSFLVPGTNNSRDLAAGWIRTNNASGNVKIQSLLQPGQAAHRQSTIGGGATPVFTSSDPDVHLADDATRFYVDQNGTFAGFVTLITTYGGTTAPNITAQVVGSVSNGSFEVQIYRNGQAAEKIPFFSKPGASLRPAAPVAGANDVAYDASGRLHVVWNDREEKNLKYAVRNANGKWSMVQTIDPAFEAGGYPSLAIDSRGVPAVAYFDGDGGDLKFAKLIGGAWLTEKVDTAGSVGLYPSLVYNSDVATIAYYKRTTGDLKLAVQKRGGWQLSNVDTAGDVGRCTSLVLNPNRPGSISIAYDDSNTGTKKFAEETPSGYAISTVDSTTPTGGGYTSLAYEPYKDGGRFNPAISYYDSSNSALKFARQNAAGVWTKDTVISSGAQGLYTSLFYDVGDRASIFFFKKTNNTAYRATKKASGWTFTYLGTGGREIQTSKHPNGSVAFTNLDADGLRVELLPS
jgi:hypothetical protein